MVDVQPHGPTGSVPTGGDDSTNPALGCLLRVDMKILRVELPRELDDLRLRDGDCPELVHDPWCIVFEIPVVGWYSKAMKRHESSISSNGYEFDMRIRPASFNSSSKM